MTETGSPEFGLSAGVLREAAHSLVFSHVGPVPLSEILATAARYDVSPHEVVREVNSVARAVGLAHAAVSREQVTE